MLSRKKGLKRRKSSVKKHSSKTVSKAKKDTWREFSIFIRKRDCLRTTGCTSWGLCISCGKRYHLILLQAGHFIPGRHNANLFYERGCHAQCYYCNVTLKGNALNYMDALINLYGEGIIEELRENNKQTVKYTIPQLKEMKEDYIKRHNNIK